MSLADHHSLQGLFTEEELVSFARHLVARTDARIEILSVNRSGDRFLSFAARGPRGGAIEIVAPVAEFFPGGISFRSLLRLRDPSKGGNWLVNGQAGTGTTEIAHFGESGPMLLSSVDRLRALRETWIDDATPERRRKLKEMADLAVDSARSKGLGDFVCILDPSTDERLALGTDLTGTPVESGPSAGP